MARKPGGEEVAQEADAAAPSADEAAEQAEKDRVAQAKQQERARIRQLDGDEEPAYDTDRLTAESHDFLGVESFVAAGALAYAPNSKKNLTVSEMRKLVDRYLNHEAEAA